MMFKILDNGVRQLFIMEKNLGPGKIEQMTQKKRGIYFGILDIGFPEAVNPALIEIQRLHDSLRHSQGRHDA